MKLLASGVPIQCLKQGAVEAVKWNTSGTIERCVADGSDIYPLYCLSVCLLICLGMNGTIRKNGVDSVPGLYVAVIGPETGVFARSGFGHTRTCIAEMYICLTNERGRPRFLVDINQFERRWCLRESPTGSL